MTNEARAGEPRTARCRFFGGLDNYTNCATHGWTGYREEVKSVRVCPEAAAVPALDVGRLERAMHAVLPHLHGPHELVPNPYYVQQAGKIAAEYARLSEKAP